MLVYLNNKYKSSILVLDLTPLSIFCHIVFVYVAPFTKNLLIFHDCSFLIKWSMLFA